MKIPFDAVEITPEISRRIDFLADRLVQMRKEPRQRRALLVACPDFVHQTIALVETNAIYSRDALMFVVALWSLVDLWPTTGQAADGLIVGLDRRATGLAEIVNGLRTYGSVG